MKTAIVYDRVNKWGGAERILLTLHEMFPDAPLFTSVYSPKRASWALNFPKVIPSFLQKIPLMQDKHEILAPLMPLAFESFDFSEYDLVISVTSEAAKGIIVKPPTKHICYCLTPTRYLWSHYRIYLQGGSLQGVVKPVIRYLRCWDKIAAQRPDMMIAISTEVQKRIKKYYERESEVIFPPVETEKLQNSKTPKLQANKKLEEKNFFLVVSRLVRYKRVDLVIKAFNELGLPLAIIGTGKEEKKLKSIAKDNIRFLKNLTDDELVDYYYRAHSLIMPQIEDFGLVAVEAQACGCPVIAYKAGGVRDTVIEGKTGIFFKKQNKDSLIKAIIKFNKLKFEKKIMLKNAQKFSKKKFKENFVLLIKRKYKV